LHPTHPRPLRKGVYEPFVSDWRTFEAEVAAANGPHSAPIASSKKNHIANFQELTYGRRDPSNWKLGTVLNRRAVARQPILGRFPAGDIL
jgi:hypothetical protein